ncbi:hypothetical protein K469DRAFT_713468 [Zopfia rhizophila CBS 207.26]|uniref:Uncharacterized protein n=1 Tax=Zopfia rhizophila CBS 207.26 TaxID=1314779 RepID=A0A6A6DQL6_9PEZI|nr:hypothetical protein K469DRAFT_713468 [Zopfia rhizophila CBS 207.26]
MWLKSKTKQFNEDVEAIAGITRRPFRLPSLRPYFKVIWRRDNALIMLINGILYMHYSCVQA